jgi:hypothetical protein
MNGNKKTFSKGNMFYKEYSKNEFMFLKMLHGVDGLHLDTITFDNTEYIEMPKGHVISIDTIQKNQRNSIRHIIIENIPFMLQQVSLLNELGIYYSDAMQWLYVNDKMYLIDMDISYFTTIDYSYNNYDLFINYLSTFDIDSSYITESLHYLDLFQTDKNDINDTFYSASYKELYNKLHDDTIQVKHIYFCRNQRYIQANIKNTQVTDDNGTYYITEHILNPEIVNEWELINIA